MKIVIQERIVMHIRTISKNNIFSGGKNSASKSARPEKSTQIAKTFCTCGHGCSADCPCHGCPLRVLIVGGIERMERKYRDLVEQNGGVLEYHAGHMKSGVKQLETRLQRADIILCPVNCNSHGACLMVKRLAKKYNKPVHMMSNFSLCAISRLLGTEIRV